MENKKIFLDHLRYGKRYSECTITSYNCDLTQFFEFYSQEIGEVVITEINHKDIRKWIVALMSQGNSARTVNRKISSLKTFFKHLQKEQKIENNPMERVISPRKGKKIPVFVSEQKMRVLREVDFGEGFIGARDQLILEMFYHTGMRLTELKNLKITSFDIGAETVKVLGKQNKERIIPITETLIEYLEKYLNERKLKFGNINEYLFLTEKGEPIYEKLLYRTVTKYLGKITTMTKKSPHVLRHTFATHLLNNGAELNAIKELLGHSNLSATQIYTHVTFEKLKDIYEIAHPRA